MKRILSIILSLLYLATSSGATINIHYCMGEEVSRGIVQEDKCGKCGMEKTMEGCCEDKEQVVKTPQDNHSFHVPHITFTPFVAVLDRSYINVLPAFTFPATAPATHNNSPPGSSGILLFILHSVFRL